MLGSHLGIGGGLHNALLGAEKLQLETVQIFTQSPRNWGLTKNPDYLIGQDLTKSQRQWASKPLEAGVIKEWREHADRLGFEKIVAHDSYLINLAAVDPAAREKSMNAFGEEMRRCDQLGIAYLVTHPGAHCGSGEEAGIKHVVESFNRILDGQTGGKVTVCLETTAGQGSCLGYKFEHLAEMIEGIERKDRVGVCVDTCHILAAGYDIRTAAGMKKTLKEMDEAFGLERVKVWHLNDSKKELRSRVDRHEHIGKGFVGLEAFEVIVRDKRFANSPKILETAKEKAPDGREWDEVNLEVLRGLMGK